MGWVGSKDEERFDDGGLSDPSGVVQGGVASGVLVIQTAHVNAQLGQFKGF